MAAKKNILHHFLIAMVAVNISFGNSNVIKFTDGVAGLKAEAEENIKNQLEQAKQRDNSQNSDRKFHWPSSVGITIHRTGDVDSEAAADAEQQLGQNDTEYNHHHHHHHQHNNSANGNDTQNGDRKFHWPSSVSISIHRTEKVDSEATADADQQLGQIDTENIDNHHHHHHNNSANGNDTQNGDRKVHWPSSVSTSIHRAEKLDSEATADADQQLGQNDTENIYNHHHHHHNNSANGNDTRNGDRKFHWPSSVGITIHRAGEMDSDAAADADQQLGYNDTEHNHYHHNNGANRNDATN